MRARGHAATIRRRWEWTFISERVTFVLRGEDTRDLGEPLSPQRAFKQLLGWFPPHATSRMSGLTFSEMASRVANISHESSFDADLADVGAAVSEGRLLVFTNLCDATRAAPTRAAYLPEKPALEGDLFDLEALSPTRARTRCEVSNLDVVGYGRRRPDATRRLLQVVAMPEALTADAVTNAGKINKTASQVRDLAGLARRVRDREALARMMGAFDRKQARRAKKEGDAPDRDFSVGWVHATSGEALVDVRVRNDGPCGRHGQGVITSGVTTRMIANEESVQRLRYAGRAPEDARSMAVTPTLRRLSARGCQGGEQEIDVEVFPGTQRTFTFEYTKTEGVVSKLTDAATEFLKSAGDAELSHEFGGSVETFEGWRDCEHDWRVENVAELSAKASFALKLKVTLSLLKYGLGVPTSLSDLLGDVRLTAGFFGCIELEGTATVRDQPPAAGGSAEHSADGEVVLTARGGVELGVEAKLGNDVLGISASGKVTPEIDGSAKACFEDRRCVGTLAVKVAKGELEVEVCKRAFIWERKTEWTFPLWEERELWKTEHVLYPHDPSSAGGDA